MKTAIHMPSFHHIFFQRANHPLHFSAVSGIVTSTLCEDVFFLVNVQWNVLHDYLTTSKLLGTEVGDILLVDGLLTIFRDLQYKHVHYRDNFLTDLECTCATANDFYRMMETAEEFWATLRRTYPKVLCQNGRASILFGEASDLLSLYSSDAVYAVQRAHMFVVREIHLSEIPAQLFSRDWEDVYTSSEVVLSLVKTMEDYLYDFHNFLCNDLLYRKVVDSLLRAMVCFYVTSLVRKADQARRRKKNEPFCNPPRALVRMMYDLELFRSYFENLTKEIPSLSRIVEEQLSILILVHECLGIAVGSTDESSLEEFIIVLHKRIGGNVDVTKHLLGDLWFLAAPPSQRKEIYNLFSLMEAELLIISLHMEETDGNAPINQQRDPLQGIKLVETLKDIYEERILQEQFSVCAPCVHAIKKVQKKQVLKARKLEVRKPLIRLNNPLREAGEHDQIHRNLKEKLAEVLKLQNLNAFVNKKPTPKFEFSLSRVKYNNTYWYQLLTLNH